MKDYKKRKRHRRRELFKICSKDHGDGKNGGLILAIVIKENQQKFNQYPESRTKNTHIFE
jgi:hypothetical protein